MSITVTIEDVQNDLSKLLDRLKAGADEVVIEEDGHPVARLTAVPRRGKRRVPGTAIGKVVVPPEFFDPLPDEIVDEFYK